MFIYNFVVLLYGAIIRIASFRNSKARHWVDGRKNWVGIYSEKISKLSSPKIVWVHCASYGEFEQGRPLIEAIKRKNADIGIVLTFFSPSGYEVMKDWPGADIIGYLPLDTKANAEEFIRIIKPQAAIFIKYEFWLNFLFVIQKNKIKNFLVSAVFKKHHPFFKWYGGIFRKSLKTFDRLYIQDQQSADLLESIGIKNYEVSGDTRFDRVIEIRENFKPVNFVAEFCAGNKVIIAGSTWKEDETLLATIFKKLKTQKLKLIIVPHEVTADSISKLGSLLKSKEITFALYSEQKHSNAQVLIIDAFGLLSKLYYYCDVAYIGGGFGDGIHNLLEAAVYLKPVIFGGNTYHKFNEASELLELKTAANIMNEKDALEAFDKFLSGSENELIKSKLQHYFSAKTGTTQKVLSSLEIS